MHGCGGNIYISVYLSTAKQGSLWLLGTAAPAGRTEYGVTNDDIENV